MESTLQDLLHSMKQNNTPDSQKYKEIGRFLGMKGRTYRTPLQGSFELTPLCNLDCKMCYVHLQPEQMNGTALLPYETWKRIATEAIELGMMNVQLTGGECLTVPWFRDFYLFLQEKGIEITVKTNALLLDEETVAFFKKHPPMCISATVYGADEEGYEAVTGKRAFHTVMKNLSTARDSGLLISISVTPNEFMKDGPRLLQRLKDAGFNWSINPMLRLPNADTGRGLHEAALDTYTEIITASLRLMGEVPMTLCPEELPQTGGSSTQKCSVSCGAGRSNFAVNWRGMLSPCINFPGMQIDAAKKGFTAAWKELGTIIDSYLAPVECEGCAYHKVCPTCVAAHADGAPMGHVNPRVCEMTKYKVLKGLLKLE